MPLMPLSRPPIRILIADDEPGVRSLLLATLSRPGLELLEAPNGVQALTMAFSQRPRVVLLDAWMPELDGFAVCRQLKADPEGA